MTSFTCRFFHSIFLNYSFSTNSKAARGYTSGFSCTKTQKYREILYINVARVRGETYVSSLHCFPISRVPFQTNACPACYRRLKPHYCSQIFDILDIPMIV